MPKGKLTFCNRVRRLELPSRGLMGREQGAERSWEQSWVPDLAVGLRRRDGCS